MTCNGRLRFCREIGNFLSPAMPQYTANLQQPATSLNEPLGNTILFPLLTDVPLGNAIVISTVDFRATKCAISMLVR